MELQTVKIKSNATFGYDIFVDDYELRYANTLDLHMDAQSIPEVTIEMMAMPDAEFTAAVQLDYTPRSLQEAVKIFCDTVNNDGTFRDGMIASIASGLREYNLPFAPEEEIAAHILDRIVGNN